MPKKVIDKETLLKCVRKDLDATVCHDAAGNETSLSEVCKLDFLIAVSAEFDKDKGKDVVKIKDKIKVKMR